MKAVVLREYGGPEVLRLEDVATPSAGPGEVLVRVHGVSINRTFDIMVRSGADSRGAPLPHVLGADPTGVVETVGPGVDEPRVGDRVAVVGGIRCGKCEACLGGRPADCRGRQILGVQRWGGYAEYVCVPADALRPIPENLSFPEATVIFRHGPTAFYQLLVRADFQPGDWVLVMGAAGALGNCLVQVGKMLDGKVIAAAGSDERVAWAVSYGADHGVNYRTQDLAAEVIRLTEGRGVDIVCENIADPTLWSGALDSLAIGGRLVTMGAHGGGTVTLDVRRLYLRRLRIVGGAGTRPEDIDRALDAAVSGKLRGPVDRVLPLREAAEAHRLVESSQTLGKVILDPTLP